MRIDGVIAMVRKMTIESALAVVLLAAFSIPVAAQDANWPTRPVQIVVSTPPGSEQDSLA